jgi:hypothetical protein
MALASSLRMSSDRYGWAAQWYRPGHAGRMVTEVLWESELDGGVHDRDLSGVDYVYRRVDGIHLGIRLGEGELCMLVMIGVRAGGHKELVALADGYRECPVPAKMWSRTWEGLDPDAAVSLVGDSRYVVSGEGTPRPRRLAAASRGPYWVQG